MKTGFFGLGKMGTQMVAKLLEDGHEVVVPDRNPVTVAEAVARGAQKEADYQAVIKVLGPKPIVWIMIPSGAVDEMINNLIKWMPKGGLVIDGGNSDYRLTKQRAAKFEAAGIEFSDVGTSGGILGRKEGFCLMVGGKKENFRLIEPILKSLAAPEGYGFFGPEPGAGHFVKMVHNGIEYGMMEAYAEGYHVLKQGPYKNLDLARVAEVWQHGSIVNSKLNELIANILKENPELEGSDGIVIGTGEGQWTIETAKDQGIAVPVIAKSYDVRLSSQQGQTNFATKLLTFMRAAFGGHDINPQK